MVQRPCKTEKDTYDHLVNAFKIQWPLMKQPKASKAERVQALKDWTLKAEELGEKLDRPGGSKVDHQLATAPRPPEHRELLGPFRILPQPDQRVCKDCAAPHRLDL